MIHDDFLQQFKILEELLNRVYDGMRVLDFENTLSGDDAEKLKLCRIVRNYIQHHSDGMSFTEPTARMVDFLKTLCVSLRAKEQTVKDIMTPVYPFRFGKIKMNAVGKKFINTGRCWFPVVDENKQFCGILSLRDYTKIIFSYLERGSSIDFMFCKDLKRSAAAWKKEMIELNIDICLSTESAERYLGRTCVVLDTTGKYLGVLERDK